MFGVNRRAVACVALAWLLAGCSSPASPAGSQAPVFSDPASLAAVDLAGGGRLRVVATTSIVADVVAHVGGQAIEVSALIPPGVDPHAFEPTPQDLGRVAEAHLIFVNGFGLEAFLETMLINAGGQAPVVSVSEGIPPRTLAEGEGAHDGAEVDPHTWLDPNNVLIWVDNIQTALTAVDPADASAFAQRADAYRAELRLLDDEIRQQVDTLPAADRLLVTDHAMFGYFADRYGFQVIGALLPGFSTAAESSAQQLAALEQAIAQLGVRAVFVSAQIAPDLAQRLAEDTGVRVVMLPAHALTGPDGPAPDYLSLMRYTVAAIVDALRR